MYWMMEILVVKLISRYAGFDLNDYLLELSFFVHVVSFDGLSFLWFWELQGSAEEGIEGD